MYNFGIDYAFDSFSSAEEVLNELIEIATIYDWVTYNDFVWSVGEMMQTSRQQAKGLTKAEMVNKAYICKIKAGWAIVTPEIHDRVDETSKNESDPIFITIHVNELESPGTYISDIFNQISKIKDRVVHITIM